MPDSASTKAGGSTKKTHPTDFWKEDTQDGRLLKFLKKHPTHAQSIVDKTEQARTVFNSEWIGELQKDPDFSKDFEAYCDTRVGERMCWADVAPEDVWKAAKSAIGQTTEFDEGPTPDDDVAGQELKWQEVMDGLVGPDGQFINTEASQNDLQSAKG